MNISLISNDDYKLEMKAIQQACISSIQDNLKDIDEALEEAGQPDSDTSSISN